MTHEEIYKEIPGFEGRYEVSNYGTVRSIFDHHGKKRMVPYVIKSYNNGHGYRIVRIRKNCDVRPYSMKVHQLVGKTFLANPGNKKYINHIDGDKANNRVTNLEWVTGRENHIHALATGRIRRKITKAIMDVVLERHARGETQVSLAREFRIDQSYISKVLNGHKMLVS